MRFKDRFQTKIICIFSSILNRWNLLSHANLFTYNYLLRGCRQYHLKTLFEQKNKLLLQLFIILFSTSPSAEPTNIKDWKYNNEWLYSSMSIIIPRRFSCSLKAQKQEVSFFAPQNQNSGSHAFSPYLFPVVLYFQSKPAFSYLCFHLIKSFFQKVP